MMMIMMMMIDSAGLDLGTPAPTPSPKSSTWASGPTAAPRGPHQHPQRQGSPRLGTAMPRASARLRHRPRRQNAQNRILRPRRGHSAGHRGHLGAPPRASTSTPCPSAAAAARSPLSLPSTPCPQACPRRRTRTPRRTRRRTALDVPPQAVPGGDPGGVAPQSAAGWPILAVTLVEILTNFGIPPVRQIHRPSTLVEILTSPAVSPPGKTFLVEILTNFGISPAR
jgi:hypothetical protein